LDRGIIHFHSNYSFDSKTSISSIVDFLVNNNLKFALLCDHDTIIGSKKLNDEIKKRNLNIEVPISAEYKTSNGDIIAAFIEKEIKSMEFDEFVSEVKDGGGILLFPHPFDNHKSIDKIVDKIDVIEEFNGRSSNENNLKSKTLAVKNSKPTYFASDAHTFFSLANVIVAKPSNIGLKQALLDNRIQLLSKRNSSYSDLYLSQIIKSFKMKKIKLFLQTNIDLLRHLKQKFKI